LDSWLIGLVGVIAGAIVTGGVQLLLADAQRRNDALAAARVAWSALAETTNVLRRSEECREWRSGLDPLRRILDRNLLIWDEQRVSLARAVDSYGFRRIEIAFSNIRNLLESLSDADELPDRGFRLVVDDARHEETKLSLLEALEVLRRAAQGRRDRFIEPRREAAYRRRVRGLKDDSSALEDFHGRWP
jgi:hypothetical protein